MTEPCPLTVAEASNAGVALLARIARVVTACPSIDAFEAGLVRHIPPADGTPLDVRVPAALVAACAGVDFDVIALPTFTIVDVAGREASYVVVPDAEFVVRFDVMLGALAEVRSELVSASKRGAHEAAHARTRARDAAAREGRVLTADELAAIGDAARSAVRDAEVAAVKERVLAAAVEEQERFAAEAVAAVDQRDRRLAAKRRRYHALADTPAGIRQRAKGRAYSAARRARLRAERAASVAA